MLFQITNNCHELCPHCLQCSCPSEAHMSAQTLSYAIGFAKFMSAPIIVISGGEPTSHPQFLEFCERVSKSGIPFSICSNGSFIDDEAKTKEVIAATKLKGFIGMQVYTHKDFYQNYEKRVAQRALFENIKGVVFDTHDIENMQDVGRARSCSKAQEYIDKQKHVMGCVNMSLIGHQSESAARFVKNYNSYGLKWLCKPLVDWQGNIHMSESAQCPSVGNVVDDNNIDIVNNMRKFVPCMKCRNSQFIYDSTYDVHRRMLCIPEKQ